MRTTDATRATGSSLSTAVLRGIARAVTIGLGVLWGVVERAFSGYERWRQRQALMRLDEHLLKDIGLSRADVEEEVRKPFWRS